LITVADKYSNSARIDHSTRREMDIDIKAPARTPKSVTKEVPLQQLFSHVKRLIPPTTIRYGMLHDGSDFIRSRFPFEGKNIENGFPIQPPPELRSNIPRYLRLYFLFPL
jgi:hypothetical protein